MIDLFGVEIPDVPHKAPKLLFSGTKNGNPCIRVFGPGPPGAICKTCSLLAIHEYSKRYYKCRKRGITASAATDHRIAWPACGKYEKAPDYINSKSTK